jgi:hypothetical protein
MRKAVRRAVVLVACALFVLVALPTAVRASGPILTPILTLTGRSSGSIGSTVTYAYSWDATACSTAGVIAGDTVILVWENSSSSEPIGSTLVAIGGIGGSCAGTVTGRVPGDSTTGDTHVSTAYVQNASLPIGGSEATANQGFFVTPAPTPTPKPTSKPTARPTPSPRPPTSSTSAAHHGALRDPKGAQAIATASGTHPGDAGGPPHKGAVITSTAPITGASSLLAVIPGGWFGLGIAAGVVLAAGVAATLVTMERRRFARMYPKESRRGHR